MCVEFTTIEKGSREEGNQMKGRSAMESGLRYRKNRSGGKEAKRRISEYRLDKIEAVCWEMEKKKGRTPVYAICSGATFKQEKNTLI